MDLLMFTKRKSMKISVADFPLSYAFSKSLPIASVGMMPLDKLIELDSSAGFMKVYLSRSIMD